MRIDIYLDTDVKTMGMKAHGHSWYIMECTYKGKPLIKDKSITWMEHNKNGALLECLLYALTQIKAAEADIHVYTDSPYIAGHCTADQLQRWEANGYLTKEGTPIKHGGLWRMIAAEIHASKLQVKTHQDISERFEDLKRIGEKLKHA